MIIRKLSKKELKNMDIQIKDAEEKALKLRKLAEAMFSNEEPKNGHLDYKKIEQGEFEGGYLSPHIIKEKDNRCIYSLRFVDGEKLFLVDYYTREQKNINNMLLSKVTCDPSEFVKDIRNGYKLELGAKNKNLDGLIHVRYNSDGTRLKVGCNVIRGGVKQYHNIIFVHDKRHLEYALPLCIDNNSIKNAMPAVAQRILGPYIDRQDISFDEDNSLHKCWF